MRIHAPNPSFNGKVGADTFINGVCDNPAPAQLEYYLRQGYTVDLTADDATATVSFDDEENTDPEPSADDVDAPGELVVASEPPAGNASRDAWAEFLASRGIEVPEAAKRAELQDLWGLHADTDLTEEPDAAGADDN